jgi:DNA invertase Pin-like site-specific DNA recombinase
MKLIALYRVSTRRQGKSGLGLDAQRSIVQGFGTNHEIVAEFTEVESGRKANRPQLQAALLACRQRGATLVVAKLDRLARNVHFLSTLMESGVEFIACDMPSANRMTIQILAAVAEDEAQRIRSRTKDAWQQRKSRGWQFNGEMPANGWQSNQSAAAKFRKSLAISARQLRDKGLSLIQIAHNLNGQGLRTRQNKPFTPTAVWRILNGATGGAAGRF